MNKPAIFLDRDGTLIEDMHYPKDPEKVCWFPGAAEALLELQNLGFLLFVVSNQSGVGRGLIKDSEFRKVHERFCQLLRTAGVEICEFAYCFHRPEDRCGCRKPETKQIIALAKTHGVDLQRSFTVGDKWSDVLLGTRVGATGLLLSASSPEAAPAEVETPHICTSWSEIIRFIRSSKRA